MPVAICSTKKNDVRECVKAMLAPGYCKELYQFSRKTYAELEKNQNGIPVATGRGKITNLITMMDKKIHKKNCKKAVGATDAIEASIVRCDLTGLRSVLA